MGLTQAQSLVTSTQLHSFKRRVSYGNRKSFLRPSFHGSDLAIPILAHLPIVTTDTIRIPDADDSTNVDDLVSSALKLRPDLAQAALQMETNQIFVNADRKVERPQLDFIGNFQTRGSTESPFTYHRHAWHWRHSPPSDLDSAGLRTSRIYQAGIQFSVPIPNRVAQADAARDAIELKQAQTRTQRLKMKS